MGYPQLRLSRPYGAGAPHGSRPLGEPDAELVRAALTGAREPLAELIERHWPTAVFLAARLLGSAELGRDAAQEAAVAVLTDLDRLRSPDRFGAWFCGIALNVARRWRRQLRLELPGTLPERPSQAPGPAEAAELADIAARVRGAVAALPDGQRDAVLLFYLLGLTQREVAAELGISVNAVKARLHQARASLAPGLAPLAGIEQVEAKVATNTAEWVDVMVSGIRMSQDGDEWQRCYVMALAERGGERELPIWIGPAEAIAMAMSLESAETPRPFTHKLAASLVGAAGARVAEVRITRLAAEVFYALVVVDGTAGRQEVDARPSDAVNLALATGAPIQVEAGLFAAALTHERADELASLPVATAEIAVGAQRRIHERRQCRP
ncbi:MAG TPA: bifunctional nuclease domain-containing protein [Streptosporangiaceae bacterium]|nr:bifunctional nuclease domain-containing protein [Streptosporangiaceae bacterium]